MSTVLDVSFRDSRAALQPTPKSGRKGSGRGALVVEYARVLEGRSFDSRPARKYRLAHGICHHSGGEVSTDATIQTCWDADRLDLGRVRIKPSDDFLSEEGARRTNLAYAWSRGRA